MRRRLLSISLVCVVVLLTAAGSTRSSRADSQIFRHQQHLDEGAGCNDCHDWRKTADSPPLIEAICIECHDETPPHVLPAPARDLGLPFPHRVHAEKHDCEACHARTLDDTQPGTETVLAWDACSDCHEESKITLVESRCASCHGTDVSSVEPSSHGEAWLRYEHGPAADWSFVNDHGGDCYACHQRSGCVSCHNEVAPTDHNGLWRNRSHGPAALWDRERCRTCHESGSCDTCHRHTQPMNHRGAWEATHGLVAATQDDAECRTCHESSWCRRCHLR